MDTLTVLIGRDIGISLQRTPHNRRENFQDSLCPHRKAYIENSKELIEKVDIEWNSPILEWGTNLTRLN